MTTAEETVAEMRDYLREAGEDQRYIERSLEVAALRLGLSFRRAFAIWYGRTKSIAAHEMDNARQHIAAHRERKLARLKAEIARLETVDAAITARLDAAAVSSLGAVADQPAAAAPAEAGEPEVTGRGVRL